MMSRFAEPRQGRGSRLPKAVRPAALLIGAAIGYSQLLYPQPRPAPAPATVTPIRRAAIRARMHGESGKICAIVKRAEEPMPHEHLVAALKFMRDVGRRIREEQANGRKHN